MDSHLFSTMINALKTTNYFDHQMDRVKMTIGAAGQISGSQVAQLMKYFPSDADKLELAKTAYGYATDRMSFGNIVGDKFNSHDTKTELHQYIHRY